MRKLLLATTALAGAAMIAGTAQAGMEVTVGGYNDFRAGYTDLQSSGTGNERRNVDFENEFQLEVEAKGKTNNGMEYGAVATLWNGADYNTNPGNQSIRLHQSYGYVNGSWGQFRAGDEHGASDFAVHAPLSYDFGGQVDGNYTEFLRSQDVFAIAPSFIDDDENSTKISYFTPKLSFGNHKVQAGVSYAPNYYGQGQNVQTGTAVTLATLSGSGVYKDYIKAGAKYEGSFMDKVNVTAGVVLQTGDAAKLTLGTLTGQAKDFTSYDIGGQVGYAGFTVGGNYTDAGSFGTVAGQDKEQDVWSAGASYKFDRASVAGSYLSGRGYNNLGGLGAPAAASFNTTGSSTNYSKSFEAYGFGAGYSVFDGMTTSIDATFFKQEGEAGTGVANNEGQVVIISNRVAF